jgi:hypothetical protein
MYPDAEYLHTHEKTRKMMLFLKQCVTLISISSHPSAMKPSWPSLALFALGIFLAVAPFTIAPVCEVNGVYAQLANGKTILMPCGWTARAEIGIGAMVVLVGILLPFGKSADSRGVIGVFGAALGVLAILFPVYITKMCAMPDHPCNTVTKPTLIVTGLVIIAVSGLILNQSRKV